MTGGRSVSERLMHGLTWTAGIGGLLLIVFVSFDVELLLEQQTANVGWRGKSLEIVEHVVLPLVVLMAPMYLAIRWVVRTSLVPLAEAAHHIDAVSGNDRGFRLDVGKFPDEVLPFANALNNLLGRLDEVARQREAAAADAAHELKTPLAILVLELDRFGGPDADRLKQDVRQMSRLLDQMLLIAQVDAHTAAPVPMDLVNLGELAEEVVAWLAPIALGQDKAIQIDRLYTGAVLARRELVKAAMRNLVDNGLRATPPKGTVSVIVGPGERFRVRDGGPGLTVQQLARRIQRLPRSNPHHMGGAGMGLSITSRIMTLHAGTIETVPEEREVSLEFRAK